MKRTALIAGLSIAALMTAGPLKVQAATGAESWWGNASTAASTPTPRKSIKARSKDAEGKAGRAADKSPPIPSGPLHIIVSIDKQRATLFADGQPIASTAVSTGTVGHPTPMGLFTVIQKDRHHISNLYDASMPYMQRITWSGSALHQGPLPGYPASHGCVRLTESFAQLLWKTTKMGARIIITHPDVAPLEFAHGRLFVPKPKMVEAPPAALPVPTPVIATEPGTTSSVTKVRTADAANTAAVAVETVSADATKAVTTSVTTEPAANAAADQPTKQSNTDGIGGAPAAAPAEVLAKPAEASVVEAKPSEMKPVETKPAVTLAAPAPIIVDERAKTMPAATVHEAVAGRPISVFVSLKENKLYVRQGWKALFDAPVSFEHPEQPIGTHVYTAMGVKAEGDLRWTVVSIPSGTKRVTEARNSDKSRKGHHETVEVAAPMPSPSAALDRIVMPQDLVDRISAMIVPGSSLIVSDNRLSDETGDDTDFIVLTR